MYFNRRLDKVYDDRRVVAFFSTFVFLQTCAVIFCIILQRVVAGAESLVEFEQCVSSGDGLVTVVVSRSLSTPQSGKRTILFES